MTLLFHNTRLRAAWREEGEAIDINKHGISEKRKGFQTELAIPFEKMDPQVWEGYEKIHNLMVAVKGPSTVAAISSVAPRLTSSSTIVLLQNGMGIMEEINTHVFPNVESRPQYMLGVITHGIHSTGAFKAVHAGFGTIALGVVPRTPVEQQQSSNEDSKGPFMSNSARYMLRTLTRTPVLGALGFPPVGMIEIQMEKLALNAVINPLTAIYDCTNGELMYNLEITSLMRLLLAEISLVIRSLPEMKHVPNLEHRFSSERLEYAALGLMTKTAENESSMLQDVRKARPTEVDYINGYFVRRGEDLGIRCIVNFTVMQMVKGKSWMQMRRNLGVLPLERLSSEA